MVGRKRVVFSFDRRFDPPLSDEDAKTLTSTGMRTALSFAHRFEDFVGMPWIQIHARGTNVFEASYIYADTGGRQEILRYLERSHFVSIIMSAGEFKDWIQDDKMAAICVIDFKLNGGKTIQTIELFFDRETGERISARFKAPVEATAKKTEVRK